LADSKQCTHAGLCDRQSLGEAAVGDGAVGEAGCRVGVQHTGDPADYQADLARGSADLADVAAVLFSKKAQLLGELALQELPQQRAGGRGLLIIGG